MRYSNEMNERMRAMLARDKVGAPEGFTAVFSGDLNRLFNDYFDLEKEASVSIVPDEKGNFTVSVSATAKKLKQFSFTADLPK